jgi:APA family basic amino acid/polyamine antiporter
MISGLVALTTGTAVFGIFVAGPRFIYAMGKAGFFFQASARLDPKTGAPKVGIVVSFAIAAVYFVTSTFGQILAVYAFVGLTVEVLGVLALFALRRQRPDAERPVRVPFYPVVPLLYAAACALLVVGAVSGAPVHCLIGAVLMAITYPVFRIWKGLARVEAA